MGAFREFMRRQPRVELAYHALRRALSPRRNETTATPYGFRMTGNELMVAGEFEAEEIEVLRGLLPRHDRFIDIGANVGFYTCFARQMGTPVIAVEPLPENAALLLDNLSANEWSDSEVIIAGLSDKVGIGEIYGSDTAASLVPGWASRSERSLIRERTVLTTLDSVLAHRFTNERLLIKVDVEGTEFDLLKGARQTLTRSSATTWLMEICLSENFPNGRNPHYIETFDLFFDHGYRAFIAKKEQKPVHRDDVVHWLAAGGVPGGVYNYLFCR